MLGLLFIKQILIFERAINNTLISLVRGSLWKTLTERRRKNIHQGSLLNKIDRRIRKENY